MPTIELTDEQAEELMNAIQCEIARLNSEGQQASCIGTPECDADAIAYQHSSSVLSDILHLLEIA